jgi:hypothetical protein
MSDPVAVSGDEKEPELSQSYAQARPRVVAEPVVSLSGSQASPARPAMAVPAAGRLPSGMGSITKPDSVFHMDMGRGSQVQSVPLNGQPIQMAGSQVRMAGPKAVTARPSMGAPGDTIAKFPAIEAALNSQLTDVSFSKASASIVLEEVNKALIRVSAPENAKAPCVVEMGPGMVEKATSLKVKLERFVASEDVQFKDFTTAELQGANKVMECAIVIGPAASGVNSFGLAMVVLIATAAGVAYWVNKGK